MGLSDNTILTLIRIKLSFIVESIYKQGYFVVANQDVFSLFFSIASCMLSLNI